MTSVAMMPRLGASTWRAAGEGQVSGASITFLTQSEDWADNSAEARAGWMFQVQLMTQ